MGRRLMGYCSLFTSFGTLLCCALPSLLVLVGLGGTVASLLSEAPWLVSLSRNKNWVFLGSGVLIACNVVYSYVLAPKLRQSVGACTTDAIGASGGACEEASAVGRVVLWVSVGLYGVGVFSAYLLGPLLMKFG